MKEYHLLECKCKAKKIRALNKDTLELFTNNENYVCPECKSTYQYIGIEELKADKRPGVERDYITHDKKKTSRGRGNRGPYLTHDNLINEYIIYENGKPRPKENSKGRGGYWAVPLKHIIPAISVAIDDENNELIEDIFNEYKWDIKGKGWKYLAKKRKKVLKRKYPEILQDNKI